jgi:hypothetical protein
MLNEPWASATNTAEVKLAFIPDYVFLDPRHLTCKGGGFGRESRKGRLPEAQLTTTRSWFQQTGKTMSG